MVVRLLVLILTCLIAAPAQAACDALVPVADLRATVKTAESAFARVDVDRFLAASSRLEVQVPCLGEPAPPDLVAAVHRITGLRAFVGRNNERAQLAFASARAVAPDYRFPETMLPPGHPALADYVALAPTGATEPVPPPAQGELRFDGQPGFERPAERPTLVQLLDPGEAVVETAYLWPGVGMLLYDTAAVAVSVPAAALEAPAPPPLEVVPPPRPRPARQGPNGAKIGLFAGAGGAAVAAGLLYGLASSAEATWADPTTPYEDLGALRARTNTLATAASGCAVVAAGTGVGAVLVGRF